MSEFQNPDFLKNFLPFWENDRLVEPKRLVFKSSRHRLVNDAYIQIQKMKKNNLRFLTISIITACAVAGCGGGSGTASSGGVANYSLGGSISGLSNDGLVLTDGVQPTPATLTLQANSPAGSAANFVFNAGNPYLNAEAQYAVSIQQQPNRNRCSVTNGTGTVTANVNSVHITCVAPTVSILVNSTDYANATGDSTQFNDGAESVAVDGSGNVYAIDRASGALLKITPAGLVAALPLTDAVTGAQITSPALQQVAVDATGKIYVAANPTGVGAVIQTITQANLVSVVPGVGTITSTVGVVSPLAGSGQLGATDGAGSVASFSGWIKGLALDSNGNIYVGDYGYTTPNNKIRKVTAAGAVSTLAGSGAQGATDGPGATASFNLGGATGSIVTVDANGNVYVAEWINEDVRKITPSGIVSTFAGGGGRFGSSDGPGTTVASFSNPIGIAADGSGNVYVLDGSNNIRMIMQDSMVSTLVNSSSDPIYGANNNVINQGGIALTCLASSSGGNLYTGGMVYTTAWNNTINKITFN